MYEEVICIENQYVNYCVNTYCFGVFLGFLSQGLQPRMVPVRLRDIRCALALRQSQDLLKEMQTEDEDRHSLYCLIQSSFILSGNIN